MRTFIVLCLVAFAAADHLGYNYHPVDHSFVPGGLGSASNAGPSFGGIGSGSNAGPSFGGIGSGSNAGPSFAGIGSGSNAGPSFAGIGSGSNAGPSFGGIGSGSNAGPSFGFIGSGSNGGPSFGGNNAGPTFDGAQGGVGAPSNDDAAIAPQAELEKEFYTFTADEQDFNEPAASNQVASSVKQGLRVVFIKGPEQSGLEDAALSLARQAAEQRTAIYVLNKQADLSDLANKLNQANSNVNNKPEVHFVKYRTPEDAINAQKAIQGEYDALGGKSQHIDGGVAPSLNFASHAPAAGNQGAASQQVASGPQGSFGQQGSFGPHGSVAQQGSFGPQGSFGQGSFQPQGSFSHQVAVGPQGSAGQQGSFGVGSGPAASGVSATYLPASILRRSFRY